MANLLRKIHFEHWLKLTFLSIIEAGLIYFFATLILNLHLPLVNYWINVALSIVTFIAADHYFKKGEIVKTIPLVLFLYLNLSLGQASLAALEKITESQSVSHINYLLTLGLFLLAARWFWPRPIIRITEESQIPSRFVTLLGLIISTALSAYLVATLLVELYLI